MPVQAAGPQDSELKAMRQEMKAMRDQLRSLAEAHRRLQNSDEDKTRALQERIQHPEANTRESNAATPPAGNNATSATSPTASPGFPAFAEVTHAVAAQQHGSKSSA